MPASQSLVDPSQDHLLALVCLALGLRAVAAAALEAFEPALDHRQVGERELEVELLEVARRVDAPRGMRMRRVLERADDVEQRVGVAQPREVVGRQLLGPDATLGRSGRRRQVDVGDVGLDDLLGLEDLGESVEPLVGDLDDARRSA